jgi:hypothetical protein
MARIAVVIVCVLTFCPWIVCAHDMVVPDWCGQDGTTRQEWSFANDSNPALPDFIINPYGDASAAITLGDMASGWLPELPGYGTQTGFWDLGGGGIIVIDIDNRAEALAYKEIWIQTTYYLDMSQPPIVEVFDAMLLDSETYLVEDLGMGGWYLDLSKWRIEPNPPCEQITLTSDMMWGSVIDQIVVDTICVPEPMSIGLWILGGLTLLKKRRQCK